MSEEFAKLIEEKIERFKQDALESLKNQKEHTVGILKTFENKVARLKEEISMSKMVSLVGDTMDLYTKTEGNIRVGTVDGGYGNTVKVEWANRTVFPDNPIQLEKGKYKFVLMVFPLEKDD